MSNPIMLKSNLDGYVIQASSTGKGAALGAYPATVDTGSLGPNPTQIAANQAWEVLPDPAGSSHYIIKNPATGFCIDIEGNSLSAGAALDAYSVKTSGNENQLWDFLPDPFGSGSYLIQNPQTGFFIEINNVSTAVGAPLVVKQRKLFGGNNQLWSAIENESFSEGTLPSLTLAAAPSGFGSNNQYVLLAPNQSTNLTSVVVTIDVLGDMVTESFSIQINGNAPSPADAGDDAQWMQYGLLMQNNGLYLWNQVWHALGPDKPGDPLASQPKTSSQMLQLANNTIPKGTQIVLTLTIDSSYKDFVTGVSGKVFNSSGTAIGTPTNCSVIGQATFNPGGPVQESDLAPLGALSIVVVGPPGGNTNFSSGMGTITVTCDPAVTVSSQLNGPNPHGIQTAEQSNCYYGQVQAGSFKQIVQPFGVLSPAITEVSGVSTVSGTGLYPNSNLSAKAVFTGDSYGTVQGIIDGLAPSRADGSFGFIVEAQNTDVFYATGTLSVTVTDSQGNSAWANISYPGNPKIIGGGGSQRAYW